jgi:hypothetical protein
MSEPTKMALFNTFGFRGFELRDYFAAKAMQGLLASWDDYGIADYAPFAKVAYKAADAMLAERENKNE